jgi:amidase
VSDVRPTTTAPAARHARTADPNTPSFSLRLPTNNDLHGLTRNPWNKDVTPDGTSGGAASAIAAGIGAIPRRRCCP